MSLLNDMLTDLESGKPTTTGSGGGKGKSRFVLPVIAALAVVFWLVIELNLFGLMPEKSDRPSLASNSLTASAMVKPQGAGQNAMAGSLRESTSKLATAHPGASLAHSNTPRNLSSQSGRSLEQLATELDAGAAGSPFRTSGAGARPQSPGPINQTFQEIGILTKADELLSRGHGFTPSHANALMLYRSVLVLDPKNSGANAGVERIKKQVALGLKSSALEKNSAKLEYYRLGARLLGLDDQSVEPQGRAFGSGEKASVAKSRSLGSSREAPALRATSVKKVKGGEKPAISNTVPSHLIQQSSLQKDRALALKISQHGYTDTEHAALHAIASGGNYENSAFALIAAYFSEAKLAKLKALHKFLVSHNRAIAGYAMAHYYALDKQYPSAIEQLSAIQLPKTREPGRLRMLAGLYQLTHDDVNAAQLYTQLVRSNLAHENDWLGLAVTSEKLGNAQVARKAYRQVTMMGHENPNVVEFVNSRLNQL